MNNISLYTLILLHCNRAAVSRNRYGVEKTVDTHKILINAITFYVCLQEIRAITKLPNSEQSNKGKVKTHKYINRQNQSTTGKL